MSDAAAPPARRAGRWRRNVHRLAVDTFRKWQADNCLRLGASLSYYTVFSLFPLILVTLTIVRLLIVNSSSAQEAILDALSQVTGGFRDDFESTLKAAIETSRASGVIGTILLILGATWVFGELTSAFDIIWGVEAPNRGGPFHFLRTTIFSFALVLAGTFLLLVSMIISAVLASAGAYFQESLPGGYVLWRVTHTLITVAVLSLVFLLLLKYLPQTYIAWRDVWLGAILTAILWSTLQFAISYYITLSSYKDYGSIGAILALVVWVNLSSQVLFIGGEFTVVYARCFGSRAGMIPAPATPLATAVERRIERAERGARVEASRERLVGGAAGVTIGVLATIGALLIGTLLGLGRTARRWLRG